MSLNRLFIYDPESNSAVCIAKGYSSGWGTSIRYVDDWFDDNPEYNAPDKTRYQLVTENGMPEGVTITWEK
jgi:hypothetical protein